MRWDTQPLTRTSGGPRTAHLCTNSLDGSLALGRLGGLAQTHLLRSSRRTKKDDNPSFVPIPPMTSLFQSKNDQNAGPDSPRYRVPCQLESEGPVRQPFHPHKTNIAGKILPQPLAPPSKHNMGDKRVRVVSILRYPASFR